MDFLITWSFSQSRVCVPLIWLMLADLQRPLGTDSSWLGSPTALGPSLYVSLSEQRSYSWDSQIIELPHPEISPNVWMLGVASASRWTVNLWRVPVLLFYTKFMDATDKSNVICHKCGEMCAPLWEHSHRSHISKPSQHSACSTHGWDRLLESCPFVKLFANSYILHTELQNPHSIVRTVWLVLPTSKDSLMVKTLVLRLRLELGLGLDEG